MTIKEEQNDPPLVDAVLVEDEPEIVVAGDVDNRPPAYNPEFSNATPVVVSSSAQQSQQPVTTSTVTVTTSQVPPTATPPPQPSRPPRFGSNPTGFKCPHCQRHVVTRTRHIIDPCTVFASILLLFVFWPLFWLPFCIPSCKTTVHYCECGRRVGRAGPCS